MKNISIYIKSLTLQNVRVFGDEQTLNLTNDKGLIPQWTLLLGDNGIGKSTLLQCIAWMKPSYGSNQPYITDEENETLIRLVRETRTKISVASITAIFTGNQKLNIRRTAGGEKNIISKLLIRLIDRRLVDVKPKIIWSDKRYFQDQSPIIYAYSAARTLGKLNIDSLSLQDTIPSFIAEKTELYDAENILHTSNYAALGARAKERKEYENYIVNIKKMLSALLPEVRNENDIEIIAPKLVDGEEIQGSVMLTTRHGRVPFKNASLGYRTVMSWAIDIAWRLFKEYPNSPNPLLESAIVLIDEVDLHLHPLWQREIMNSLSTHFPNVQFIATAHSPLMVQAAVNSNYAVLQFEDDGVAIINEPKDVDGWRVDQILTSEIFGLESSRGIKYEQLHNQRKNLLAKKKLTPKEDKSLQRIESELKGMPMGETEQDIENRKVVEKVISEFKSSNTKLVI